MLPKGLLHGADFQDWGLGLVGIDSVGRELDGDELG